MKLGRRGAVALAAMAMSLPVAAQPGASGLSPLDLTPLLRALDSPRLEEREAAQAELASNSSITLREVLGLLGEVTALSPEQRARLIGIAREMFVDSPRAAMGVQFGGTVEQGVAIQSAVEGFDSARVLKPGDAILAVDGEPVTQSRLRAIIISHDPGEALELKIRRIGEGGREETLDATVTLGSMNRLARGGGYVDVGTLIDAWRERLSRAGVADGPAGRPIETGVDQAAWLSSAQATARWTSRGDAPGTARAPGAGIAGEPRSTWTDPGSDQTQLVDAEMLEAPRQDVRARERMAMREELMELQRELEALRGAVRVNAAAMQSPNLTDAQRARLSVENQRLTGESGVLELRMAELRGRLSRQQ